MSAEGLAAHEAELRLGLSLGLIVLLGAAERLWPCRGDARPAWRQLHNLGLMVVDTLLLRLAFPLLSVGFAAYCQEHGIGLLRWLDWPWWLQLALAMLALDLLIWVQHFAMHRWSWLWRLHRVHHSDIAFDLSLALRFHPLEIGFSQLLKLAGIACIGASPLAVLLFEMALAAGALFTHADFRLPRPIEKHLSRLLVTPELHRIHHSLDFEESNRNFGTVLVLWDQLFGRLCRKARLDPAEMPLGVPQFRDAPAQTLPALLAQPFHKS